MDSPATPEPIDLLGNLALPDFPIDLLPPVIALFARDQSELMGMDPSIVGMTAIVAVAAALDDRVVIQLKRHDPLWTESARLWLAHVGPPSSKKSPGLKKALAPAFAINGEWRKEGDALIARWEREAQEAAKAGEDPPDRPLTRRLIFEDATVEKLADAMSKLEPRGVLVFRDELSGWLASMDCYKSGAGKDRAAWLEAYNGHHLAVDRIGRGSIYVENWSASVVGGIQPSVVADYATASQHDGMLQRFMVIFARNADMGVDRSPDMRAKQAYEDLVRHAAGIAPSQAPVRFSEEAHAVREELFAKLNAAVCSLPNQFLTAALGKWESLFARLALVWHVADAAAQRKHPASIPVAPETAEGVAKLMWGTLLPHAMKFYSGVDTIEEKAQDLARLILARGWQRFTVRRDLAQNLVAARKWSTSQMRETLGRLFAYGWITPDGDRLDRDGMPAAYLVNARVHARFQEHTKAERERRAVTAAILRDIRTAA